LPDIEAAIVPVLLAHEAVVEGRGCAAADHDADAAEVNALQLVVSTVALAEEQMEVPRACHKDNGREDVNKKRPAGHVDCDFIDFLWCKERLDALDRWFLLNEFLPSKDSLLNGVQCTLDALILALLA